MVDEKEARLTRIVHKLEAKVKAVWDENKELNQKLEIATLDREIAEESAKSLGAELQELCAQHALCEAKIAELEELHELGSELEASYVAERQRLESEIKRLETALREAGNHSQTVESLQIELRRSKFALKAAEIDLSVLKNGVSATFALLFTQADWLPLVDFLAIDVSDLLTEYRNGNISLPVLEQRFEALVDSEIPAHQYSWDLNGLNGVKFSARVELLLDTAAKQLNTDFTQVKEDLKNGKTLNVRPPPVAAPVEMKETNAESPVVPEQSSEVLRIEVLEEKLAKAQGVADELDRLLEWQADARRREATLREQLQIAKQENMIKEAEITRLRKELLPDELFKVSKEQEIRDLQAAVRFLNRSRPELEVPPLPEVQPWCISQLAGNPRVHALRRLEFELGGDSRELALKQSVELMLI